MRTRKAFYNMSSSMFYQIVAIICGLITPRLILASFGSTYNGIIASANQFLNMINILTLGITGATRVQLYKTLANKDTLGTSRIMKATKQYMRKVGFAVIVYAIALCIIYPLISHNDLSWGENAALIAIVSIGTFAQYFFGISNQTLLRAAQETYVINFINVIKIVLNTICVYILIKLNCTIFAVKLGSSLVFFFAPLLLEIIVRRKYNLTDKCEPDNAGIKGRKAVAFHSIANLAHDNTDITLLTFFADAKIISVYTVYYLVIGEVKRLLQIFTSGMEAAFGDMWAKKEYTALNRNFRTYEYLIYCFTIVVFSCIATLILPFVAIYTRGITDVNYIRVELAILISLAEGAYCIRQPYLLLVYATGMYEETKKGAAVEAILNLTISLVLVYFIGIPGVVIGTLVANLFRTTQYILFSSKTILKRSAWEVAKRMLWTAGCFAVIVPSALMLQPIFASINGWTSWIVKACVTFAIAMIVTVLASLLFYRSDFMALLKKGMSIRKKKA